MPLPVIADIFRVTFNWEVAHGIRPRNVLHFGSLASGNEAGLAAALAANFDDAMWSPVQQDWAFSNVDIIKLDGISATQTIAVPAQGSLSSGDWVNQAAAVISAHTAQRGPRGRGRVYLGPVAESQITAGTMNTPTAVGTAWDTFRTDMAADDWEWVVASYTHSDAHVITSVVCDDILGTQRRRNDQLR